MTENPSKLFVYSWENMSSRRVFEAEASADRAEERLRSSAMFQRTPVQAYVREDVAAAREAAAEAKYKDRDVEVMRVALADLRRIRACFVARANSLRTIGEVARASGLEDAIKQLDEEVFT